MSVDHSTCRIDHKTGECVGWHCPNCGASTSYQGHICGNRTVAGGVGIYVGKTPRWFWRLFEWFK